jgi:tetratricopeptide (TPR) repeat protein
VGSLLAQQDKFDEAFDVLQRGLDLSKSELGDDNIITKRFKEGIALLYLQKDQRNQSLAQYQQGLDWVQTELDRDNPLTLTFLCKVASVHYEQHLYNEALSLYLSALEGLERANNTDVHELSQMVLTVTSNVANLQEKVGNYDEALEYFNRSLRMRQSISGRTNPGVLEDMHRITSIYICQSRYEDALGMLRQVQRREETAHGAASPQALATLSRMATIHSRQGNNDIALSHYQRALSGLEIAHGPNHPDVFRTLHSMSEVHLHLGDFDSALAALIRAAEGMVESPEMGCRDLDTLATMHDLALVYDYLERQEDAMEWWRPVLKGYRDKLGEQDPRTREASQRVNQGPSGRARGLRA